MPGSYADLLAESRRRQAAERRAQVAEAKLARITDVVKDTKPDWEGHALLKLRAILEADS